MGRQLFVNCFNLSKAHPVKFQWRHSQGSTQEGWNPITRACSLSMAER